MENQLMYQQQLQAQVQKEQFELFQNYMLANTNQQIVQQQQQGEDLGDADEATVVDTTKETENQIEPSKTEEGKTETSENENVDEQETGEEDPVVVEVNKRHGIDLKYELPEGVVPDSPEGLYIRDIAFKEAIVNDYEQQFQQRFPDAYRLALHQLNGGTIENFDKVPSMPKWDDVKEDLEVHKSLYLRSLKEKGMDDEDAQLMLENRIKKGGLDKAVEKYIKDYETQNEASIKQLEQEIQQKQQEINQKTGALAKYIQDKYNTKIFPILTIPDNKVSESYAKFVDNIVYEEQDEVFNFVVQITNDNLEELIQLKYMLDNKDQFFKAKQKEVQQNQVRTLQRANKKVEEQQAVSIPQGLKAEWFKN